MNLVTRLKEGDLPEWAFLAIAVCIVLACAVPLAMWLQDRQDTVVSASDGGAAITAEYADGKTRVETDKGVFLVQGSVALQKGERYVAEERKNGDRMLCRADTRDCHKLAP